MPRYHFPYGHSHILELNKEYMMKVKQSTALLLCDTHIKEGLSFELVQAWVEEAQNRQTL